MTDAEWREFLMVLRRALLMVVRWIEKTCGIGQEYVIEDDGKPIKNITIL